MRKRLQIALMVSPVLAASFSLSVPRAFGASDGKETPSRLIATTDDSGRTIYTNDSIAATPARAERASQPEVLRANRLVYWSVKEKRYKPVDRKSTRLNSSHV